MIPRPGNIAFDLLARMQRRPAASPSTDILATPAGVDPAAGKQVTGDPATGEPVAGTWRWLH